MMSLEAETNESIANKLRTLGHPVRIGIVKLLQQDGMLSVGEICAKLDSEQSLTSHHLKNMRLNGILTAERQGKRVYYRLSPGDLQNLISFLEKLV